LNAAAKSLDAPFERVYVALQHNGGAFCRAAQTRGAIMAAKTENTGNEFFQKASQESVERMNAAFEEAAKLQKNSFEQSMKQFDEMTKIWKSTLTYQMELQEQMRNTMLEATRRSVEFMTPKA